MNCPYTLFHLMLPPDAAFLPDLKLLIAYLIFAGSYLVFALGRFPWTKIDRVGAAIIGAVLMISFRIVGAREAPASLDGVSRSFGAYFRIELPVTIATTVSGSLWLWATM
jgi:Na+/H+ antiporter NhaD/arsenite permease-like protein